MRQNKKVNLTVKDGFKAGLGYELSKLAIGAGFILLVLIGIFGYAFYQVLTAK